MTTKAIIKAQNNEGYSWIYIVYTHNRVKWQVATNEKIKTHDWDAQAGKPTAKYLKTDRALNSRIEVIKARVDTIVNLLVSQQIDPTVERVKGAYKSRKETLEDEIEETEIKMMMLNLSVEKTVERLRVIENMNTGADQSDVILYTYPANYLHTETGETIPIEEYESLKEKNPNVEGWVKVEQRLLTVPRAEYDKELKKAVYPDYNAKQEKKILKEQEKSSFLGLFDEYLNSRFNIRESSRKKIGYNFNKFREFEKVTGNTLAFNKMDMENFYIPFSNYIMKKQGFHNNYFSDLIKTLKTYLAWVEERGIPVNVEYRKFKRPREKKDDVIVLEEWEIDLMYLYEPKHESVKKQLRLKMVLDIAVFLALTGLRKGDALNRQLKVKNGVLTNVTEKNDGLYQIPLSLDNRIEKILKKYNYFFKCQDDVFNYRIGPLLAEMYEHHGKEDETVEHLKRQFKTQIRKAKLKSESVTLHSFRRSFITNCRNKGFSDDLILKMLGSKNLEVLQSYKRTSLIDVENKIKELQGRLS